MSVPPGRFAAVCGTDDGASATASSSGRQAADRRLVDPGDGPSETASLQLTVFIPPS